MQRIPGTLLGIPNFRESRGASVYMVSQRMQWHKSGVGGGGRVSENAADLFLYDLVIDGEHAADAVVPGEFLGLQQAA